MNKREDELFEVILKEALSKNMDKQITETEKDIIGENHTFSKEHNKKMKKLFKISFYKTSLFKRAMKNIAVFFVCSCLIFAFILSVSPQARAFVKNMIIKWTDNVAIFSSQVETAEDERVIATKQIKWTLSYFPDGYEIIFEEHTDIGTILYESKDNSIVFGYSVLEGALFANNEDVDFDSYVYNDVTYYTFVAQDDSNKENILIWELEGYRFSLSSYLDIETLKEMAYSLQQEI